MADHGTTSHYLHAKCRCEPCRASWSEYQRTYRAEIKRLAELGRFYEQLLAEAPDGTA